MATPQLIPKPPAEAESSFSPIDNEPPLRWQRAVRLAPAGGLGVARRAAFFALLSWLPIAIWSFFWGRFVNVPTGESLVQHYGVHVRCLIVIPLLILGEATLHNSARRYVQQFLGNGLIDDTTRPRFEAVLRTLRRWRDSSLPWLMAIGLAISWTLIDRPTGTGDEMSWAFEAGGRLSFGGAWFAYIVRPIFITLLLGWLWRVGLLVALLAQVGRLGLALVPSHPDRAGGLGFLEKLPIAFAPVTFALSAMIASHWAHQVLHHGQSVMALKAPATMFIVVWSLVVLSPLATLMPVLIATKRAALPSYSAMVAEQGRLVRRRWIDGTTRADAPLLEPEGVGPITDAAQMFDIVRSMRKLPVGKPSFLGIGVPIAVPMLVVAALQIPIRDLAVNLVKALL